MAQAAYRWRRVKGELLAGQGGCLARPQTRRSPADSREVEVRFSLGRRHVRFLAGPTGMPRAWQATVCAEQTLPALERFFDGRHLLPALPLSRDSWGMPSAMKGWGAGFPHA